jgi:uridine kinase
MASRRKTPKNKTRHKKKKLAKSRIFFIGIAGASGCGKSYFTKLLKDRLVKNGISAAAIQVISCDSYYKTFLNNDGTPRQLESKETNTYVKTPEYIKYNWDHPDAVDLPLLETHLKSLENGEDVVVPEFDFNSSIQTPDSRRRIYAAKVKIVIVEGLFTFYLESLRRLFDLRLFISSDMEVCLVRRLLRDREKRDSDYDRTINQYIDHVKPAFCAFIEPTRIFAEFTIHNSYNSKYTTSMNIVCEYVISKVKNRG